ncbi:MAG: hypothetical protein HQL37_07915, partial [Alphaproteobacteria bacterium]|nr:hypothetical protein [Alphaproteobacteria bacterium]
MPTGVALSSAMRLNLLALQDTSTRQSQTQEQMATGYKVNSAIDNPSSYFTAQALTSRASDLSSRMNAVGQSLQTLAATSNAINAISSLVSQAQSLAQAALSAAGGNVTQLTSQQVSSTRAATIANADTAATQTAADASQQATAAGVANGSTLLATAFGNILTVSGATATGGTNGPPTPGTPNTVPGGTFGLNINGTFYTIDLTNDSAVSGAAQATADAAAAAAGTPPPSAALLASTASNLTQGITDLGGLVNDINSKLGVNSTTQAFIASDGSLSFRGPKGTTINVTNDTITGTTNATAIFGVNNVSVTYPDGSWKTQNGFSLGGAAASDLVATDFGTGAMGSFTVQTKVTDANGKEVDGQPLTIAVSTTTKISDLVTMLNQADSSLNASFNATTQRITFTGTSGMSVAIGEVG